MSKEYEILLKKLDFFIRKYYKNQLIKGLLLALIIYLVFYLTVAVSEYFGHFAIKIRTALFYTTLFLYSAIFIKYILIPLLHFLNIGKLITYRQAASIISRHFTDVQDKLLNTLELAKISNSVSSSPELIAASIEQRAIQIRPIQFNNAIDLGNNLKYLWFLMGCVAIFLFVFLFSPAVIRESSQRLVNYTHLPLLFISF